MVPLKNLDHSLLVPSTNYYSLFQFKSFAYNRHNHLDWVLSLLFRRIKNSRHRAYYFKPVPAVLYLFTVIAMWPDNHNNFIKPPPHPVEVEGY